MMPDRLLSATTDHSEVLVHVPPMRFHSPLLFAGFFSFFPQHFSFPGFSDDLWLTVVKNAMMPWLGDLVDVSRPLGICGFSLDNGCLAAHKPITPFV